MTGIVDGQVSTSSVVRAAERLVGCTEGVLHVTGRLRAAVAAAEDGATR
jgi:hypothetical protein